MKKTSDLSRLKINSKNIKEFAQAEAIPYTAEATDYYIQRLKLLADPERAIALCKNNKIIGTTNSFSSYISIPNDKSVKVAAVSYVSVQPTHRRKGILTEMMNIQLNEIYSKYKEPLAILWPSETAIYGRFGYAPTKEKHYKISKNNTQFKPGLTNNSLEVKFLNRNEAINAYVEINNKLMSTRPGVMKINKKWAQRRIDDLIFKHLNSGPAYFIGIYHNKKLVGFATYSIENNDNSYGNTPSSLYMWDIIYLDLDAAISIWNFCLNIDLVEEFYANGVPEDDILEALLISPSGLNARITTGFWIRIVDVVSAITLRSYEYTGNIVFKVKDSIIKNNNKTYILNTNDKSNPVCEISNSKPDIEITIQGLSEIFLGTFDLNNLIASGNINIKNKKAIKIINKIFKSESQPFCPMHF